jgi:hypothetical protein
MIFALMFIELQVTKPQHQYDYAETKVEENLLPTI